MSNLSVPVYTAPMPTFPDWNDLSVQNYIKLLHETVSSIYKHTDVLTLELNNLKAEIQELKNVVLQ